MYVLQEAVREGKEITMALPEYKRYRWLLTYSECTAATMPVTPPWTGIERIALAEAQLLTKEIAKNMKLNLSALAYQEFVNSPYWKQLVKEVTNV